jgi:hypothetical protein
MVCENAHKAARDLHLSQLQVKEIGRPCELYHHPVHTALSRDPSLFHHGAQSESHAHLVWSQCTPTVYSTNVIFNIMKICSPSKVARGEGVTKMRPGKNQPHREKAL